MRWRRKKLEASAPSLRGRLLLTTLGASVLCWLVSLSIVVGVAWYETSEVFDDAMEEAGRLTLQLGEAADVDDDDEVAVIDRGRHRVELVYQLLNDDGDVLRRAEDAPRRPFVRKYDQDDDSFHNVSVQGESWRVYVRHDEDLGLAVQIGQRWDDRTELLHDIAENLAWPMLVLLLLLTVFIWLAIRHLLRPLEGLASHVAAKSPDDLSAVPMAGQARELGPLVRALNTVFLRLTEAMQAERRFTADAAHELRTPLAGLRMRIQLMQRQRGDVDPALSADLRTLREDVDRSTSLVENLLALARLDPRQPGSLETESVALQAVLDDARRGSAVAAQAAGIDIEVDCAVDAVEVHAELMTVAVRNLIDNAVRYGTQGGRVQVQARREGGEVVVAVRDDGPGVPASERARLGQRFFRVLGSGQPGSGLGLSIVSRIVALHGGTLSFGDGLNGRGLSAVMRWPAAGIRSASSSAV